MGTKLAYTCVDVLCKCVVGVKSYPRGVTTNSESGIESYDIYYPVFQAMEEEGMVLNLHGEIPSDADKVIYISVLFYI